MVSIELDFTPSMVNRNNSTSVIIGNSGELIKLDKKLIKKERMSKPFPTPIVSGVIFDDIWVGIWFDRELRDARMAALSLNDVWSDGIGRDVLRLNSSLDDNKIIPECAIWQKILTSEPMALSKIGENIVFAMMNKGIYMIDKNGTELWREHYPIWPEINIPQDRNPIVKIIEGDNGIIIWSAGGGIMELDDERNLKRSSFIKFKDKITDIKYDKKGGWFIILHGKSIALMQNLDQIPVEIKTPGPVMDACFMENEWKWTGWRHDGSVILSESGVIEKYSNKIRENIGIHIHDGKIITNEGELENHSS